jgi:hypothetical protein
MNAKDIYSKEKIGTCHATEAVLLLSGNTQSPAGYLNCLGFSC